MKLRLFGLGEDPASDVSTVPISGRVPDCVSDYHFEVSGAEPVKFRGQQIVFEFSAVSQQWAAEWNREVSVYKDETGRYVLRIAYTDRNNEEGYSEVDFVNNLQELEDLLLLHEPEQVVDRLTSDRADEVPRRQMVDTVSRSWYAQVTNALEGVTEWENSPTTAQSS